MKVFISWSGDLSKAIAQLLSQWIKGVVQATEPFISTEDIEKGVRWFEDIASQLADSSVGIICLTSDNLNSPWILFEAGALSKGIGKSRVCTLLINVTHSNVRPPLSHFNGTIIERNDLFCLIQTINSACEKPLSGEVLNTSFEQWWDYFDTRYKEIIAKIPLGHVPPIKRNTEDILDELLQICRAIQRDISEPKDRVKPKTLRDVLDTLSLTENQRNILRELVTPAGIRVSQRLDDLRQKYSQEDLDYLLSKRLMVEIDDDDTVKITHDIIAQYVIEVLSSRNKTQ
jgi:hypothetical protein